jgi:DNA-binding transcriptional MerR regulator
MIDKEATNQLNEIYREYHDPDFKMKREIKKKREESINIKKIKSQKRFEAIQKK